MNSSSLSLLTTHFSTPFLLPCLSVLSVVKIASREVAIAYPIGGKAF